MLLYCGNRLSSLNKMLIFGVGIMVCAAKGICLLSVCKEQADLAAAVDYVGVLCD